jgi:S-adenosylmethionine:tRNA ribosyltransferase-isomerase
MLLRELNHESRLWDVLVDPARKIRIGNKLYFGENDDLVAEVIDNTTSRGRTLRFLFDGTHEEFKKTITDLGNTPLPPEIGRPVEPDDAENYQTVFAKCEGAVAAPTAGMHFSKSLMKHLELRDVQFAELTLHTGVGNFRDIEVEDLTKHKTDSEEMEITQEACDIINTAKNERNKIFAVGTTSLKALETAVTIKGHVNPFKGWTNKFIFPHYDFNTADALITNFHLPKSPMMMEVAAFAGYDLLMKAYKVAVAEKYRFFTYGDAMLII